MLAVIVAALALTVPVQCVDSEREWALVAAKPATMGAFYLPRAQGGPKVMLGPTVCQDLRQLTRPRCDRWLALRGVQTLAHELQHAIQDRQGRPFNEPEADRLGWLRAPRMLRRLERVFNTRCR